VPAQREPTGESEFDGRVVAAFGRHLLIRDVAGRVLPARPFGRRLTVVCGDEVRCALDSHHAEAHVVQVHARRTCLYRSSGRGGSEPVFANVALLFVALAPLPAPDYFVIDRYLCAAASGGIAAMLILNKRELAGDAALAGALAAYASAGYRTLECSARAGAGIDTLLEACAGQIAALVGQSGVGKSSLVRRLVPAAEIEVGGLMRETEGRHTTTTSRLYDLEGGGHLIDSPGVRDFAPSLEYLERRSLGFPEVERLATACRFADCLHLREPHCAVRAAAESGALHPRRYESYRRLRRLYEEERANRTSSGRAPRR
jgi:ribosome biogenesis GTPase